MSFCDQLSRSLHQRDTRGAVIRESLKFEQQVRKPALAFDHCHRRGVLPAFKHGAQWSISVRNRLIPQVLTQNRGTASRVHLFKMPICVPSVKGIVSGAIG